jgi:hypothetical protein
MKRIIAVAGALALFAMLGASGAVAQGRGQGQGHGQGHGNAGAASTGLGRADTAAGSHGLEGRTVARGHGANAKGFCPPGQRKKAGLGSRFRC